MLHEQLLPKLNLWFDSTSESVTIVAFCTLFVHHVVTRLKPMSTVIGTSHDQDVPTKAIVPLLTILAQVGQISTKVLLH